MTIRDFAIVRGRHFPYTCLKRSEAHLAFFFRLFGVLTVAAASLNATTLFYSGNLRTDATVTACPLGDCIGGVLGPSNGDAEWAQFAGVVYTITLPNPSPLTVITYGYGGGTSLTGVIVPVGGLEPYLSLFDASGNFLASTFSGITCPPGANSVPGGGCFDVELDAGNLPAGNYQLALTAWENMSLAENTGTGTLADGFTGLGNLAATENLNYAFDVTFTTPEPGVFALTGVGLAMLLIRRSRGGCRGI